MTERTERTESQRPRPADLPDNFQDYSDPRFGFRVWMPRRFEIMQQTIDPLARSIRGLNEMSEEEQAKTQPRLPIGFWDPAVVGELADGTVHPLRLFEYEAIRGRTEVPDEEQVEEMRAEIRDFLPRTLASAKMPGYEFLGVGETELGPLPALAFEYRWNGLRPGRFGGDHAFVVWAMSGLTMFHVYHHCSGDQWEKRRPELDAILGSFEAFEPEPPAPFEVFAPQGGGRPEGEGQAEGAAEGQTEGDAGSAGAEQAGEAAEEAAGPGAAEEAAAPDTE